MHVTDITGFFDLVTFIKISQLSLPVKMTDFSLVRYVGLLQI